MFIKTELEQGSDKPSFDVILGILVDRFQEKQSRILLP